MVTKNKGPSLGQCGLAPHEPYQLPETASSTQTRPLGENDFGSHAGRGRAGRPHGAAAYLQDLGTKGVGKGVEHTHPHPVSLQEPPDQSNGTPGRSKDTLRPPPICKEWGRGLFPQKKFRGAGKQHGK